MSDSYWWSLGSYVSNYLFNKPIDENKTATNVTSSDFFDQIGSSTQNVSTDQQTQIDLLFDLNRIKKENNQRNHNYLPVVHTPRVDAYQITAQQEILENEITSIIEEENIRLTESVKKTLTPNKANSSIQSSIDELSFGTPGSPLIINDSNDDESSLYDILPTTPLIRKPSPQKSTKKIRTILMTLEKHVPKDDSQHDSIISQLILTMEHQMMMVYLFSVSYVLSTMAEACAERHMNIQRVASFAEMIEQGKMSKTSKTPSYCESTLLNDILQQNYQNSKEHYSGLLHDFISSSESTMFGASDQIGFFNQLLSHPKQLKWHVDLPEMPEYVTNSTQQLVTQKLHDAIIHNRPIVDQFILVTQQAVLSRIVHYLDPSTNHIHVLNAFDWSDILESLHIPSLDLYCCHL